MTVGRKRAAAVVALLIVLAVAIALYIWRDQVLSLAEVIITRFSVPLVAAVLTGTGMLISLVALLINSKILRKLKQGALELHKGNYGYRIKARGDNPRAAVHVFNAMAEQVQAHEDLLSRTSESYSRFAPRDIFPLLGRQSVLDVAAGDTGEVECSLLCLYTGVSEAGCDNGLLDSLRRCYRVALLVISEYGGVVERFSDTGLMALFTGTAHMALKAALALFAELDVPGGTLCRAVITESARVQIGVIGAGDRLGVMALALDDKAKPLCELGARLGCRILMPREAFYSSEMSLAAIEHRFIGYDGEMDKSGALVDVFEAEPEDIKSAKRSTLEDFTRALELYHQAQYYRARELFIEIIKRSPSDLAAREYLLESDRRLSFADGAVMSNGN